MTETIEKTATKDAYDLNPRRTWSIIVRFMWLFAGILMGIIIYDLLIMPSVIAAAGGNEAEAAAEPLEVSTVFERVVAQDEMVSASQQYSIVGKVEDTSTFFGLFDLPGTGNSFWYRYEGVVKAGVDLSTAEYGVRDGVITVILDEPCIVANDPDMQASGVLEERNNVLNPIKVGDVDAFQRECEQRSTEEAVAGGLLDDAKANAEINIRGMFNAAFGDEYEVRFEWRG